MSITVDYDQEENIIYSKAEGVIQIDDILSYFLSVATLDLKSNYRVFADYSTAEVQLSSGDIEKMAQQRKMISKTNGKIHIAVYCRQNLVFGLGRMYEALLGTSNYEVMIFRDQDEAKRWLGL